MCNVRDSKAMPSLVNVKDVEHARFLTYAEARERLINSGVPPAVLRERLVEPGRLQRPRGGLRRASVGLR